MTPQTKYNDLIYMLCGKIIGWGISRKVYECRLNPEWVVKIEYNSKEHQNVMEWKVWQEIEYWKEAAKFFAPCRYISESGRILIQDRTEPIRKSDIPEKVPSFFVDQKLENYGMIKGQLVCHDYGTMIIMNGINLRLKKNGFS